MPPSSVTHSALEASIPSLELPASVLGHHISPPAQLETQAFSRSKALGSFDSMGSPLKLGLGAGSVVTAEERTGKEDHEAAQEENDKEDGNHGSTTQEEERI